MDAAALMTGLAELLDAHEWESLRSVLHPDFLCRLVHTGETFDAEAWVRFNAGYPGFQRFVLEDCVGAGERAVGLGRVTGTGNDGEVLVFAVASFVTARAGLISELTEVWTDVDQAPPAGTRGP